MVSPADRDKLFGEIRRKIEEILQKDGFESGSYPQFDVFSSSKPNEIVVRFKFPPTIRLQKMLADIVKDLGIKNKDDDGGSHMMLQSYACHSFWLLVLTHKERNVFNQTNDGEGTFYVAFCELDSVNGFETVIEFAKSGDFTLKELESVASSLKAVSVKRESNIGATKMMKPPFLGGVSVFNIPPTKSPFQEINKEPWASEMMQSPFQEVNRESNIWATEMMQSGVSVFNTPATKSMQSPFQEVNRESNIWATEMMQSPSPEVKRESNMPATKMMQSPFLDTINCASKSSSHRIVDALEAIGVKVFGYDKSPTCAVEISWDNIAGYEDQKREIEDTILLAMRCPEVYDSISHGTRTIFETSRPRAILFEGPPGTGKTSFARVIAKYGSVPLLNVPLEVVASKYYGEGENLLAKIFSLADELPDGSIIFLDEVDSLAINRSGEMNEGTRRLLSVLLRRIDGFTSSKNRTVIATTNRKEDLDPALISRFDSIITFDLPDEVAREKILGQYAKHLNRSELSQLAIATLGMSGRDIKNVCQCAERSWASKVIRGVDNLKLGNLPHIEEYLRCAQVRRRAMDKVAVKRKRSWDSRTRSKRQRQAFAQDKKPLST